MSDPEPLTGPRPGEVAEPGPDTPPAAVVVGEPTPAVPEPDPVGEPTVVGTGPFGDREWAWVRRWREEAEPTPWGPGLVVAAFSGVLVAVALAVLTLGLTDLPVLAVVINLVVGAGLGPAVWMVRDIPVVRWIGAGMGVGVLVGWCVALSLLLA